MNDGAYFGVSLYVFESLDDLNFYKEFNKYFTK